jgi:hypothetical protein
MHFGEYPIKLLLVIVSTGRFLSMISVMALNKLSSCSLKDGIHKAWAVKSIKSLKSFGLSLISSLKYLTRDASLSFAAALILV